MGKKFIPVKMHELGYKVYLDNLMKIYKCAKKVSLPVPAFAKMGVSRKASIDTTHGELEEVVCKEALY
jgi:hypothetical protein